jgi:beta-lactam-binding protein with PASTA domain
MLNARPASMQEIAVPRLVGVMLAEANAALDRSGLSHGTTSFERNDEYPIGVVVRQAPPGGCRVLSGARVQLVVNRG